MRRKCCRDWPSYPRVVYKKRLWLHMAWLLVVENDANSFRPAVQRWWWKKWKTTPYDGPWDGWCLRAPDAPHDWGPDLEGLMYCDVAFLKAAYL